MLLTCIDNEWEGFETDFGSNACILLMLYAFLAFLNLHMFEVPKIDQLFLASRIWYQSAIFVYKPHFSQSDLLLWVFI